MMIDLKTTLLILLILLVLCFVLCGDNSSYDSYEDSREDSRENCCGSMYYGKRNRRFEHLDTAQNQQNEALQSIVSVYNKDDMKVNKMTAPIINTDNITSTNDLTLTNNNMTINTGGSLILKGGVCAGDVCLSASDFMNALSKLNKNDFMYSSRPEDHTIYQNILVAIAPSIDQMSTSQPLAKSGSPTTWTTSNDWNKRPVLSTGVGNKNYPDGISVLVPAGKSVIWLRLANDRWNAVKVFDQDYNSNGKEYNIYGSGYRNLNTFAPDGGTLDSYWKSHKWVPMVVPKEATDKKYVVVNKFYEGMGDMTISGLAFSTNPWNHATNSAAAYRWQANGGDQAGWDSNSGNWNNDLNVLILPNGIRTFSVPFIYSGKDKLVFIVEHNNNWDCLLHTSVKVNGQFIERFKTTYDNPFSRHYNGKLYQRYIAAKIPASLVGPSYNCKTITLSIDMTQQDNSIFFREMGSHDAY